MNDPLGPPPLVLLVDDSPENLQVIGELLSPHCRVLVANSGARALDLALLEPTPELILLDVMMPEMDGFEVLRRLKARATTREVPVVFLTALDSTGDEVHGLAAGAVDYVTKPVQPVTLLARVQNHVELYRARQALRAWGQTLERRVADRTQELEQALAAARLAEHAKAEFLTNMSHELRTPLNGLMGLLELALEEPLADEPRELLGLARASASALLGVLVDVVDFASARPGEATPALPFEPGGVVEALRALYAPVAAEKALGWTVAVAPGVPARVTGEAARLRQVLVKLVDNAFKFTPRGSVALTVQVAQERGPRVVLAFEVQDSGVGIPPERAQAIFEPFVQADSSTKRRFQGAGLGLALAQRAAVLLGGEVTYRAREGGGSVFRLEVPFAR